MPSCLSFSHSVCLTVLVLYGVHASYHGVQAATEPCDRFYILGWKCDPPKGSSKFGAMPTQQCGHAFFLTSRKRVNLRLMLEQLDLYVGQTHPSEARWD